MNLCILKNVFRPLGLGLGLVPLEAEGCPDIIIVDPAYYHSTSAKHQLARRPLHITPDQMWPSRGKVVRSRGIKRRDEQANEQTDGHRRFQRLNNIQTTLKSAV